MLKDEVADKIDDLIGGLTGPGRILEVGTGWAESAIFFSILKPTWKIYTIDAFGLYGDGRIYSSWKAEEVGRVNHAIKQCGNVIQILGDSSTIPWELPVNLLFLDGDHTKGGVLADFRRFAPWVVKGGLVIFDDYNQANNPANGVKAAVIQILLEDPAKWENVYEGYFCRIIKKIK